MRSRHRAVPATVPPRHALHSELRTPNSELRKALTLVEVLIVLVIISIALSMAVVSVRDWSVHHRLDDAAKRVVQALRFAQGQAMVTGDDAAVEFDTGTERPLRPQRRLAALCDVGRPADQAAIRARSGRRRRRYS